MLDYLKQQKEQPDPELLREMNWTKDDLQNFLNRWQAARSLADSPDSDQRKKWTDQLQSLGLMPPRVKAVGSSGREDQLRGMEEGGLRRQAPESLRRQFEAFRKAIQDSEK